MKILMVSSEAVPFSKTGGLADVVGALTPQLVSDGHDAKVFVPSYNTGLEESGVLVCSLEIPMLAKTEHVEIRQKNVGATPYLFVCHSFFNDRLGVYGDTSFEPYADNFYRFTLFSKASLEFCRTTGWKADIIHCHDWTAGLVPYFMKALNDPFFKDTKTVFTIHNLAYHGTFPRMDFMYSNVCPTEKLFSGTQVNMLQSGLVYSDYITTVSPTYAKEIQTEGCGMEDILVSRKSKLRGIVNGIDIKEWDPQTDPLIDFHFSSEDFSGKAKLKRQLQTDFGLPVAPDIPLFAMISRLAAQKGFDALCDNLEQILMENRLQFIIIGTGDKRLEKFLTDLAQKHDNLSVNILFSNKAAHLAEAGSDFFLMPSRYEPCGLNQLYSLRYGTIPVARRTGGLADTIIDVRDFPDKGTGLLFDELSGSEIARQVKKAVEIYSCSNFTEIRRRAMNQDFSWKTSSQAYLEVFEEIIPQKK